MARTFDGVGRHSHVAKDNWFYLACLTGAPQPGVGAGWAGPGLGAPAAGARSPRSIYARTHTHNERAPLTPPTRAQAGTRPTAAQPTSPPPASKPSRRAPWMRSGGRAHPRGQLGGEESSGRRERRWCGGCSPGGDPAPPPSATAPAACPPAERLSLVAPRPPPALPCAASWTAPSCTHLPPSPCTPTGPPPPHTQHRGRLLPAHPQGPHLHQGACIGDRPTAPLRGGGWGGRSGAAAPSRAATLLGLTGRLRHGAVHTPQACQ